MFCFSWTMVLQDNTSEACRLYPTYLNKIKNYGRISPYWSDLKTRPTIKCIAKENLDRHEVPLILPSSSILRLIHHILVVSGVQHWPWHLFCDWRSLHSLKMHMITKHKEEKVNALFHEISSLILRSLLSVQNVIIQDKHCFELYGYDILVDSTLKPWLLEVIC